jgi:hypothetical protein
MTTAQVIDLSIWKLTLPVTLKGDKAGSPSEIPSSELVKGTEYKPYYRLESDNSVAFRAPVTGVTTSGSGNPRSELREMKSGGSTPASWGGNDGKWHTMLWEIAWTALPGGKPHVVGGQIHGASDDFSVFRLEGPNLYITSGDTTHYKLIDNAYTLGRKVQCAFVVGAKKCLAYYNGKLVATLNASKLTKAYFKVGCYTQANKTNAKPVSDDNYGETKVYRVKVTHGSKPGEVTFPASVPPVDDTPPPVDGSVGVGGVPAPAGAIKATEDNFNPVTFDKPGVYDGQGHVIGFPTVHSGVTLQNYRIVANNQYGAVLNGNDIVFRNNDIKGVKPTGDGDLNAITLFGSRVDIINNTAEDFVSGDPGDSHTDFLQTWVSSSHPNPSNDVRVIGNKVTGPANPDRNPKIPSIHQFIMVEGAGQGGNSGGSGKPSRWLIAGNEVEDSWNQAIKLDGVDDVTITGNKFNGSSDHVIEVTDASTNVKFLDDNVVGSGYGSIGTEVIHGGGTTTPPPPVTPPADLPMSGWPRDPKQPKRVVIILRHGEKDDNNDGADDVLHELSEVGKKRAEALKAMFMKADLPAGLWHPDRLVASKGNTASNRPLKTLQPLVDAAQGKLPINTKYDAEVDYKTLGPWLAQRLDVTMACLEHSAIVNTCKGLGTIDPPLPKEWDGSRFDLFWVFTSDDGKSWKFTQIPEKLLPGDKDTVIK